MRFGAILYPDMQTICAELELGERLLSETVERYGPEAVHGAMRYVCDASAERMATALAELPDGSWEGEDMIDCDGIDDSEEYRVRVRVTKRGGPHGGRLQRHVAPGAHVHQRDGARRQDDRRRRVEVPVRPATARSRPGCCATSTSSSPRARS